MYTECWPQWELIASILGGTQTANEGDISIGTLVEDIVQVLAQILPRDEQCVLVGHRLVLL